MSGACEFNSQIKPESAEDIKGQEEDKRLDITRLIGLGLVTIFLAWFQLLQPEWLANIIIVASVIAGGYPIFKESLYALRKGRVNMELSMVIAIIASLVLSQFLAGIVIAFFALLSEFLEGFIVRKGRENIQMLYNMAPRKAMVKRNLSEDSSNDSYGQQLISVKIDDVSVGDIVFVREGDIIPVDGHIIRGASTVDQSSITGESVPVEKSKGDTVFAGTINQSSHLEIICDKLATDTTFAKIIRLVEEAESSKAPIQRLSDNMATRLIQFAIGLSILTYALTQNITSALSVIVVAGACGLAVGTPIALLATMGKMSKRGIIVKGGLQLENLKHVGVIVFDKTGTLTYGKPAISQVVSFDSDTTPKEALMYAAFAEKKINHPLAKAIEDKAREMDIVVADESQEIDISSYPKNSNGVMIGRGVTRANNKGQQISVGNAKFMAESLFAESSSPVQLLQLLMNRNNQNFRYLMDEDGKWGRDDNGIFASTTSFVAVNGRIVGAIFFEDTLREEAKEAIAELKAMGIHTAMFTGDNEMIAKRIADVAGIDEYYANLLPSDKVSRIEEIVKMRRQQNREEKETVVMVGDGINDAPALAKADVGIAMGKTGTDVAIETADVILMSESLLKIPYLIRTSKRSIFIIKQNFFGTLFADGLGFVLAITGNLNPLLAAFVHVASEVVFMINSARLAIDGRRLL